MPGLLDFWLLLQTPSARRECVLVRGLCSGVLRRSWCLVWRMGQCQRVSQSWHVKLREFKASPLAKEEDGGTSDESLPMPVLKSAWVMSGRRHHRLRMLVDHLMCRDGRSEESLLERRAVRALAARRIIKPLLEDSSKFGKERGPSGRRRRSRRCHSCVLGRLLCPRSSPSPWFTACCCSDGSLAVMQPLWVQQTAEESFSRGSVQPHFAGDVHASVRASDIEEKGSCSTACATSPMLVGRDRRFRNWGIYRSPRWICFNGSTSACPG